ncbi:MAG: tetratricopeptide repeat protein [Candidatus Tritonobacter lacicola]|nr:tetratricopeptide repeat protein [Candidatus Tritonobacter lacicola]
MRKFVAILICAILAFLVYFSIRQAIAQRAFLSAKRIMKEEPAVSRETIREYGEALALMEKAVRLNRSDSSYHRGLGDLYLRYLPYAIKLNMAGGEGSVDVGDRKLNTPQILMLAKDEFLRAEEFEPTDSVSHLRVASINQFLSSSFQGEKLASEARSEFLKAQSLYPDSPYYSYITGLFLLENGERQEAIPYFQKAIDGDSRMAYSIIVALGDSGMKADNIKKILPRDARAYLDFAVYLLEENNPVGADGAYREAMSIRLLTPEEIEYYASNLTRLGYYQRSIDMWKNVLKVRPDYYWVYARIGDAYFSLQDWKQAYEYHSTVLEKCPWTTKTLNARSNYLISRAHDSMNSRNFIKAQKDIETALRNDPQNPGAYLAAAILEVKQERNLNIAENNLKKAIAINPAEPMVYYYMAMVKGKQGEYLNASLFWKECLKRTPENPRFHLGLAESYVKLGRWGEARKASALALQLAGDDRDVSRRATAILSRE